MKEFRGFRGTDMNLLSNTPNVTLSPEFRFTAVFSVMRWPLTNVPYLELSFNTIPYKQLNITLVKQACHIYLPLLQEFPTQKQIKFKMTTKQNIYINSLVCFSLHWKTLFWLLFIFFLHKKDLYDTQNKRPWTLTALTTNTFCYTSMSKYLFLSSLFSWWKNND